MTAAEAEAAIGRRGDVLVTAENRGLVRKWFVAQGLPALFVGGLSMRELALAYNDRKGDQFARLLKKYEEAKNAVGDEVEDHTAEAIKTIETATACPTGHSNGDAAVCLTSSAGLLGRASMPTRSAKSSMPRSGRRRKRSLKT
jgi:hypothetical protein